MDSIKKRGKQTWGVGRSDFLPALKMTDHVIQQQLTHQEDEFNTESNTTYTSNSAEFQEHKVAQPQTDGMQEKHLLFQLDSYPDEEYPELPKLSGAPKLSWLITFPLKTPEKLAPHPHVTPLSIKNNFPTPPLTDSLPQEF